MLNTYLKSNHRWFAIALLLVISCTAAGRTPQEMAGLERQDWPKEIDTPNSKIIVYEPNLESFKGNRIALRAAVSVTDSEASEPVFGGIWMEGTLIAHPDGKILAPIDVKVTEIRFPNSSVKETAQLRQEIEREIPRWKLTYSLDALLAELKVLEERKALAQGLKSDVPQILFRSHPAVLLSIQGEPAWRALTGSPYRRLDNSSFFVLQDPESGTCYLRISPFWWTATSPLGPWKGTDEVPGAVATLWKNEPQPQMPAAEPGQEAAQRPEVIAVTEPAELVWTDGEPQYAPITGTNLLYVKNTEGDVFLHIETQFSYVLLSGRWYRTPASKDAWEFVPADQLPVDFSRIPLSSEKQHVLAFVAGTPQAREAVRNAEIPQTEAVTPGPAPDLQATYDGDPQFTQIADTPVQYAVNTPYAVFNVNRRYYWCQEGIWYDSDYAVGPWFVCTFVPPAIYLIPPSCPYYYVTYCRIFSYTPRAVYVGYYPGYRGSYVWGRTVVYGTGWQYRCWSGNYWYPRPVTWGVGVRFNSYTSNWGVRLGGGGASFWGLRRPSIGHHAVVQVGVGGWWGGASNRHPGVGVYRTASAVAPVSLTSRQNLYAHQPTRLAPNPARPPGRAHPVPPGPTVVNPRGNSPRPGQGDGSTPPATGRRDTPRPPVSPRDPSATQPTPPRYDGPRTPPVAPRDTPRTPPSAPERRDDGPRNPPSRENPKEPAPGVDRRDDDGPRNPPPRENPKAPPPAPERRDDGPRTPPPRELPKAPPPAPERRDNPPPRENPPAPPPREYREAPRTPPPPPPPPREQREAPRTPPPPPPQREYREAPRTPPPPPPPPREQREAPRNPPPPPPQREYREPPRNPPPPPPREAPKERSPERSPERRGR